MPTTGWRAVRVHKLFGCLTRPQRGFALVITLSLMVLLVVVAIGLLSLSSISLRSSGSSMAKATAMANARVALQLAIGELQRELGPDQRINASADLAKANVDVSRASWLGVWDSWPGGQIARPSPVFRSWVVSGDPVKLTNPDFPSTASGKFVTLTSAKATKPVTVPIEPLPRGALAYWVSDENSKARLGPAFDPSSHDLASHLKRWQSSPAAGHSILASFSQVARDDKRLDKLFSTKTSDLLSVGQNAAQDEGSYSAWAEGLVTNVRDGGFRDDLSLYLSDPNSADVNKSLYQSKSGRGGINFQELYNFQNVWSKFTYQSGIKHLDGGPLNPDVPTLVGLGTQDSAAADPYFNYMRPMVIRACWHISVMTREITPATTPKTYKLYVVIDPIITLWNPYDVNLVMSPGGHLTVRCWGLPYQFTLKAGGTTKTVDFNKLIFNYDANDPNAVGQTVGIEIGKTKPVVMRPGEVQIFSSDQAAPFVSDAGGGRRFEGKPGWAGTGGYAVYTQMKVIDGQPMSVSMTASSTPGGAQFGLVLFMTWVGIDSNTNPKWSGGLLMDRQGWAGNLKATDFPAGMFGDIPPVQFSSPSEVLEAKKQPIGIFSYRARTESQGSMAGRHLARLTPAAAGYDFQSTDPNTMWSIPCETLMTPLSGGLDPGFDVLNGKGFFGPSYKADLGQSYIVADSIPREPPISLAAFQHANANGVKNWIFAGANIHDRILQPSVSHAIGNSFAPPSIASDATEGTMNAMPAVDHSWLANDALWDKWFVSSLATRDSPYQATDQRGSARVLFDRFTGKSGSAKPLPNAAYLYAGASPDADVAALFSGETPKSTAYQKIASLVKTRGAFNVNSTNPKAWRAFLASTAKLCVPIESAVDKKTTWKDSDNAFASLLIPNGGAVKTSDLSDASKPDQWVGYRNLTDAEIGEFADAMVAEVRLRGPFLSIADFINRRVGKDLKLATKGAVQAALDKSVNKSIETGPRSSVGAVGAAFPEADQGSQMTHVPGHVKQADVLTSIGSQIQVRGDTFTIRAYGEAHDAAGKVTASACCEAVVRREAAWVDPVDDILCKPGDLTSPVNKRFGRRFTQLSFCWLNPEKS